MFGRKKAPHLEGLFVVVDSGFDLEGQLICCACVGFEVDNARPNRVTCVVHNFIRGGVNLAAAHVFGDGDGRILTAVRGGHSVL